jgi:hypothetical protein
MKWYIASLVLFILADEQAMLVTLPAILLLIDYWPLEKKFHCGCCLRKSLSLFFRSLRAAQLFLFSEISEQ